MKRITFPEDFLWGSATASYQIEGGRDADGKGASIWDRFSHIPGKILDGTNGDVACDSYHLYKQDIALMKEIGLTASRFSISWPRIFPDGKGRANGKGMDYYKRVINLLAANNIKPVVTLYHWDLPQKLQDSGGWANRDTVSYFEDYARHVFRELGDSVALWITHNEPSVVAFAGNWQGRHAPGITDFSTALQVSHHLLLSHGRAVRAYRETGLGAEIGITLTISQAYPEAQTGADKQAALRQDGYWNRWFVDPVLKGSYPSDMLRWYRDRVTLPEMNDDDLAVISSPIDFLGLNNYYAWKVREDRTSWPLELSTRFVGDHATDVGWGVDPKPFYDLLTRMHREYSGIKIYVTENGIACRDHVDREGKVMDVDRIDYLGLYLTEVHRALEAGVKIGGYFVWTLLDNFEWAQGLAKRFGIVYVDFATQKRILKESGRWYRDVIRDRGFTASE